MCLWLHSIQQIAVSFGISYVDCSRSDCMRSVFYHMIARGTLKMREWKIERKNLTVGKCGKNKLCVWLI